MGAIISDPQLTGSVIAVSDPGQREDAKGTESGSREEITTDGGQEWPDLVERDDKWLQGLFDSGRGHAGTLRRGGVLNDDPPAHVFNAS